MTFNMRPVPLAPLLEQAVDANQAYAGQLGVSLVLNRVPAGLRLRVDTDRFMQVMTNLLSNAAKFSPPEGKVVVEARRRGRQVRVMVTDNGPGVPPEFRSRIFQKFAQAQPASERGGSGLGLSITKAIVHSLSGRIDYESKPGHTTFHFDIPEWKPGASSREEAGEDHWAGGH
jgi:signal transduction histidine kinase